MTAEAPVLEAPAAGHGERFAALFEGRRVAIVHDWLNGMRGGERVLEQFCELFPKADVHTLIYEPSKVSERIRAMRVRPLKWFGDDWLRRHYRKALPLLPMLVRRMPTARYDVVIATSHCVAKAAPPPRNGLMAAYVFSPMRYVWGQFHEYLGQGVASDAALKMMRGPMQRWDATSNDGIDSIAADSSFVAKQIRHFWKREARVICPSVDLERFIPNGKPPEDFFLVVSALVPYKRIGLAIEAARRAKVRLVVIGSGPERARLESIAGPRVQFMGHVPDAELPDWYARCRALLYPGVEDFGITALEAQACGRPVLAFARGGAAETVVAPLSGRFFRRPDSHALGELIKRHDDRDYDAAAIRRHAERFSPLAFRNALVEWLAGEDLTKC